MLTMNTLNMNMENLHGVVSNDWYTSGLCRHTHIHH